MPRRSNRIMELEEDSSADDSSDSNEPTPPRARKSQGKQRGGGTGSRRTLSQPATSRASRGRASPQPGTSTQNGYDDFLSQPSTSKSQKNNDKAPKIPEELERDLISSVVKYLLAADRAKTVILKSNINKHALPNHSKVYRYIMDKVIPIMADVFGYKLVEFETNKFILTNNIENTLPHLEFSASEKAEQTLLFIALSHIFMCDAGCTPDELFNLLRSLEIIEENNFTHEYFGNVKHLIEDKFVKEGYLDLVSTASKMPNTDEVIQVYKWGPRADSELEPRNVLEFMSKIFGGASLNTWPKPYQKMLAREKSNRSDQSRQL